MRIVSRVRVFIFFGNRRKVKVSFTVHSAPPKGGKRDEADKLFPFLFFCKTIGQGPSALKCLK